MSDRVTNVEIEDVLTSIRKLVADGEWIRQRAAEANAAKGAEPVVSPAEAVNDEGKFVLTPALRVIESCAKTIDDILDEDSEYETTAEPETISDILEMFDEDESFEDLSEEEDAERGTYKSLGAAIAELEAAVGSESDDWEPDGSETVLNDFTTPLRPVGGMDMPDIVDDEPRQAAVDTYQMVSQIADAITETAIVGAASTIEDKLDEDLAAYLSEETALDEDMLRNLVTEVVRSELEGELGERMTRNIRKLVRREVFSILESREAE